MPFKTKEAKAAYQKNYWKKNRKVLSKKRRIDYWNNHELRLANNRKRWSKKSEQYRTANKLWRTRLRQEVLDAYGNHCKCCGEKHQEFLCVDHVYGGGRKHMKLLGGQSNFYLWLRQKGFPKRGFRLLCHNCNFALGHHGKCPHKRRTK